MAQELAVMLLLISARCSCCCCCCLQSFHNVDAAADIWNHVNPQFWQYVLPGCDALGYVGCTGTNVCIRARCLAQV
jgi:hypothetical protein